MANVLRFSISCFNMSLMLISIPDFSIETKKSFEKRLPSFKASLSLGYKDSNLEMLESESSALPFGDSPISITNAIIQ